MKKKFMEDENRVSLEKEDLESVTGGIKWGEKKGGKGPRQNYASIDSRPAFLPEDELPDENTNPEDYVIGYKDTRRGGII